MIGERLRLLRKKRGMTLQELSDSIGVAKSTIAGYEAGYRQPPLDVLKKMSIVLHASTDYILGLSNTPLPKETTNIKEILQEDLDWDGRKLTKQEIKPVYEILELLAKR